MKRQAIVNTVIGSVLLAGLGDARAADYERGRQLYENHCTVCHESQVHIRENHKSQSLDDLLYQIHRWQRELALSWTAEDVDDVRRYLNQRFYRFDRE